MDKSKTYSKLLRAHDDIYEAIEVLEDTKATGAMLDRLTFVLDKLVGVEALLDAVNGDNFWRKE